MLLIGPGRGVPVAYFAAENSFLSPRALPTASFNAGPRRSLAKIRPLGPIRNVAGIPRIMYVSPTFWKSFAGGAYTPRDRPAEHLCPAFARSPCVRRRSLGGFVARHADEHEPRVGESLLDVLDRGHLGEARLAPRSRSRPRRVFPAARSA